MQTKLTDSQVIRYYVRALNQVTDFYFGGSRFRGNGTVRFSKGRALAIEIAGDDEPVDLTDHLLAGNVPSTAGGRDIFPDVPDRVACALHKARRAAHVAVFAAACFALFAGLSPWSMHAGRRAAFRACPSYVV